MSEPFSREFFASAERVPVWTKARVGAFTAFASGEAPRFSAWDAPAEPTPAPEADPSDRIATEAFAQGFQDGYAAASATLASDQGQLQQLAEALEALRPAPPADLANMLAETVSRLVRQIVGEVTIDTDHLAARIQSIAALIEDDGGATRLRLHPEDVARLEGVATPLPLIADATLSEGTIVAEGASGWIEDGPAIRMERLRQALDAMATTR
jgi:flagellar assembly protein FliH